MRDKKGIYNTFNFCIEIKKAKNNYKHSYPYVQIYKDKVEHVKIIIYQLNKILENAEKYNLTLQDTELFKREIQKLKAQVKILADRIPERNIETHPFLPILSTKSLIKPDLSDLKYLIEYEIGKRSFNLLSPSLRM